MVEWHGLYVYGQKDDVEVHRFWVTGDDVFSLVDSPPLEGSWWVSWGSKWGKKGPKHQKRRSQQRPEAAKVIRNWVQEWSEEDFWRFIGQDGLPTSTLRGQRVANGMPTGCFGSRFGSPKL